MPCCSHIGVLQLNIQRHCWTVQQESRDKWSSLLLSIQAMQQAEEIGEANTWKKCRVWQVILEEYCVVFRALPRVCPQQAWWNLFCQSLWYILGTSKPREGLLWEFLSWLCSVHCLSRYFVHLCLSRTLGLVLNKSTTSLTQRRNGRWDGQQGGIQTKTPMLGTTTV